MLSHELVLVLQLIAQLLLGLDEQLHLLRAEGRCVIAPHGLLQPHKGL